MKGRRGMRNIFSDEDIELMLTIRREEEERARKAAQRSSRAKRAAEPRVRAPAPNRKTVSKPKKIGKDGPGSPAEG
jgi:septal ring factor EnvC (AmiA/AmiB activator)